jgi:hypothetical protein
MAKGAVRRPPLRDQVDTLMTWRITMAASSWEMMRELASTHDRINRVWTGVHERGAEDVTIQVEVTG